MDHHGCTWTQAGTIPPSPNMINGLSTLDSGVIARV
jgi:hypothetical protein